MTKAIRQARRSARQARKQARQKARLDRIRARNTPEAIAARKKKRKQFFKKIGRGIKHVAGGLLCVGKAGVSEVLKNPKLMTEFSGLVASAGAAAEGVATPETMGMSFQALADMANTIGSAVVDKCIKDPSKKKMAKSMIQVTDLAKYADIAHQKDPMSAVKAMIEDTHQNTESAGAKLARRAGVSPEVLKRQFMLAEELQKKGIGNFDTFLKLPPQEKVQLAKKFISKLSQSK